MEEGRKRNRGNALSAYEAIRHYLSKLTPTEEEWGALAPKLTILRNRLIALGYVLDPDDGTSPADPK